MLNDIMWNFVILKIKIEFDAYGFLKKKKKLIVNFLPNNFGNFIRSITSTHKNCKNWFWKFLNPKYKNVCFCACEKFEVLKLKVKVFI